MARIASPSTQGMTLGQRFDIKIRLWLGIGETALAKQVYLCADETPMFDAVTLGLIGLNQLSEEA